MRKTLAPSLTQQWLSVCMGRWHQSIARREVARIGWESKGVIVEWRSLESRLKDTPAVALDSDSVDVAPDHFSTTPFSTTPLPALWRQRPNDVDVPQVVLIDRASVERAIDRWNPYEQKDCLHFQTAVAGPPVFLLWDWGESGKSSLGWATSIGFAGVIFDFSSLRSWARVAVERLPSKLREIHPLIAKLPPLIRTTTQPQS